MMNSRAVIIGGGGFIGTNLGSFLVKKGFQVVAVSRTWLNTEKISNLTRITADINEPGIILARIVDGADFVFHLVHGTTPGSSMQDLRGDLLGSVSPSLSLMEACASVDARLIFLSSGGTVYGVASQIPTPEDCELLPISGYGISKLVIEKYLHLFLFHKKLRYTILRLANPYGPWQLGTHGQGVIGSWLQKVIHNKPIQIWGNGNTVRDYVYIEDVLAAVWATLNYCGPSNIFNIGSGRGYNLNEIISLLSRQINKPIQHEYISGRLADVPTSVLDISKAKNLLGWFPNTSFEQGLFLTYKWLRHYLRNHNNK